MNTATITSTRFHTHICLLSGQLIPNLTPLLSDDWCPERVIFVTTDLTRKNQQDWMTDTVKNLISKKIEVGESIDLDDAFDTEEIMSKIGERIEQIKKENPGLNSVAVNMTGGTKAMTVAAQDACEMLNVPLFYVNIEDNSIQLRLNRETIPVTTPNPPVIPFQLRQYLNAYGLKEWHEVLTEKELDYRKRFNMVMPAKRKETSLLAGNSILQDLVQTLTEEAPEYGRAIMLFNWYAAETVNAGRDNLVLPKIDESRLDEKAIHILDRYLDAGLIKRQNDRLVFRDENARFFVNGGWLEDYIFDIVRKIQRELPPNTIQDVKKSYRVVHKNRGRIEFTKEGYIDPYYASNELDVVFLAKNRLFLIECKTKRWDKAPTDGMGNDTLYKLDSISGIGGTGARGMLVSFQDLNAYTQKRAKDLRVATVQANQLSPKTLEQKIRDWINGKRIS